MNRFFKMIILAGLVSAMSAGAQELKAFYEAKKKEVAATFVAPQLGSQVTIKLAAGQMRTGILMKLNDASISLMTDGGNLSYKRMALHESSRERFFAADYAHVKALELTRNHKNKMRRENLAEEATGIHAGTLYVSGKVGKDSDKQVEKEETESKRTGEKLQKSTTTRSYSETQELKISVGNTSTHSDGYTVEYFFFCKTVVDKNNSKKKKGEEESSEETEDVRLQDKGSQRITVAARRRENISILAEPCVVEKVTTSSNGRASDKAPRVSGKESAGYLVLLKHGTTLLDKKASHKSYLTDEWVRKFN